MNMFTVKARVPPSILEYDSLIVDISPEQLVPGELSPQGFTTVSAVRWAAYSSLGAASAWSVCGTVGDRWDAAFLQSLLQCWGTCAPVFGFGKR